MSWEAWEEAQGSSDPKTLVALSKNEFFSIRIRVAKNPHTPPESLVQLTRDDEWAVCYSAYRNPNTPYGIWVRVYGDVFLRISGRVLP